MGRVPAPPDEGVRPMSNDEQVFADILETLEEWTVWADTEPAIAEERKTLV